MNEQDQNLSAFERYIKRQSATQISSYEEKEKAFFFPSPPSIILNFNSSEYDNEFEKKSQYERARKFDQGYSPNFSTIFHEYCHCYNILGTSLGSLLFFISTFQRELISKHLKSENSKFGYNTEKDLSKKNKFHKIHSKTINHLEAWLRLKVLTGNDFDYRFHPFVKDYFALIDWVINSFFNIYKNLFGHFINFHKQTDRLYRDLVKHADHFIDARFSCDEDKFIEIPTRSSIAEGFLVPTMTIIEGYAKWCEIGNLRNMAAYAYDDPNPLLIKDKLEDIENKKFRDSTYAFVMNMPAQILDWIDDFDDFKDTCSAIFELSLMTRLHPLLLFEGPPPKLEELLIPFRFRRLMIFFSENKVSLKSLCKNQYDRIEGLDIICKELGWLEYSSALKILLKMYQTSILNERYDSNLASFIIKKKLKGDVFLYHHIDALEIPCVLIFQDILEVSGHLDFQLAYTQYGGDICESFPVFISDIITEVFSREFMVGNGFDKTIFMIKRLFMTSDKKTATREEIEYFLKKCGYLPFIKADEIYPLPKI